MSFVEASIRRMSPTSRIALQRRLVEHADNFERWATSYKRRSEYARAHECEIAAVRAHAVLGRFSALTASLEVR